MKNEQAMTSLTSSNGRLAPREGSRTLAPVASWRKKVEKGEASRGDAKTQRAEARAKLAMKRYYPVFLDLEGRKCVVVGGGEVAARKARSLTDAGARVKVVSPEFSQRLLKLAEKGKVVLDRKAFQAGDLDGVFLAIACTDDAKVNERVYTAAKRRRVLANVVDSTRLCDFIIPSVVSRGALKIAISTSGVSPALARRIRKELEKRYGRRYSDFLGLMGKSRCRIIREVPRLHDRKKVFDALTADSFLAKFLRGNRAEGKKLFEGKLKELLSSEECDDV